MPNRRRSGWASEPGVGQPGRPRSTWAPTRTSPSAPDEVAVVENATRAWDMAFYSLAFKPGDRILTARAEYASNAIAYLQVAARTGAVVEVVDDDEHGQLSVADLLPALAQPGAPVTADIPFNGHATLDYGKDGSLIGATARLDLAAGAIHFGHKPDTVVLDEGVEAVLRPEGVAHGDTAQARAADRPGSRSVR